MAAIFQIGSKFGIRKEVVPTSTRDSEPIYVFWTGESWSRTVWREFPSREMAENHLAAHIKQIMTTKLM
jgi:hypothetical protein